MDPATRLVIHLPSQTGEMVCLDDRIGIGASMIVFYRGHWCPFCRRYLCKLQANLDRFRERGVELRGICPEPIETIRSMADDLRITFPLLSDADGRAIEAFGVRNAFAAARAMMPHPAAILLDREGNERFRSVNRNYKRRTTMHALFRAIASLTP